MALTRAQIQTAFQNSLGRAASQSDENSFFSVSQSGALTDAQIFSTISNSQEANLNADPVVRFYQAAFGRVPDQAGLDNATDYVRAFGASAATYQNLSNMFAQSQEFTNRFGTGTAVDAAYVQALYSTILGRQATANEINGYVSGAAGYTTRGGVLYAISQSQEAIGISDTAVNGFLNNAAQGTASYSGTLYTAQNGQPNVPGQTPTTTPLTANIDNLVGGAGNDLFIGTNTTFQTGDALTGGEGTDTLRVVSAASFNAVPTLTSVERVEVQSFGTGQTAEISLANSTGVTTVATVNGGSNTTFSGLKTIVAAEASSTSAGDLALTYNADVVSGTADVQALTLSSAVLGTVTIQGIETVNVAATGTSTITALTDTSLKTINVTGSGNLTIGNALANDVTFNGSAATGNLTANFGLGASTVTGGSGNDKFIFAGNLGTTDTVTGGAGTDTLSITGIDFTADTTGVRAALNTKVTGVEQLEFTGGAAASITGGTGATSFTNTEITKLIFNTTGGGVDTVLQAGSARTYAFGELNTGDARFDLSAGANTINLSLEGVAGTGANFRADVGAVAVNLDAAAVTGTTATINLASLGASTDTNNAGTITAVSGSTLNITGSHELTVAGLTNGTNVNASALTGKLTLTASGENDSITVGSGGSVVTGGVGVDAINFSNGSAARDIHNIQGVVASTNRDVVTGFSAGAATTNDQIQFANTDTTAANTTVVIQAQAAAPTGAITFATATNDVLALNFNLTGTTLGDGTANSLNGTNLLAAIGQGINVSATTNTGYIAAYQGGNAYLYHVVEGTAGTPDTALAAGDIQLVGTYNGVAVGGLVANSFAIV